MTPGKYHTLLQTGLFSKHLTDTRAAISLALTGITSSKDFVSASGVAGIQQALRTLTVDK